MSMLTRAISLGIRSLTGTFFQTECIECGTRTDSGIICQSCFFFHPLTPPFCERCGQPTSQCTPFCGSCGIAEELLTLRSQFWFTGVGRSLLLKIKFQREWELLKLFEFKVDIRAECLVPVPLDPQRYSERTFNQAQLLAEIISKNSGCPVFPLLIKKQQTEVQSLLNVEQRKKNLRGAFRFNSEFPIPDSVLLLDDVLTTGSTLNECAKTLKKAGVKEVSGWTLFRTLTPFSD